MTAPAFVRKASSGYTSGAASCSFTAPSAGDLIIAAHFGRGASSIAAPTGFTAVAPVTGPTTTGNMYGRMFYRVSDGTETSVAAGADPGDLRSIQVAIYTGLSSPGLDQHAQGVVDGSTGPTNPSITPSAGVAAVLFAAEANNPNYAGALASYTLRNRDDGGPTPRCAAQIFDDLVDPTTGSYATAYSGAGGETSWIMLHASFIGGIGGGGATARSSAIVTA